MRKSGVRLGLVTLVALTLIATMACTQNKSKDAQTSTVEASKVVQAGQLEPRPATAPPTGWVTTEATRGGLHLVATYDSKGPAAWDTAKSPLVYFTSVGRGYSHRPSKSNQLPGVQVVDANTKATVASAVFDLGGTATRQPHGLGVSPDGQWAYIGYAYDDDKKVRQNVTLVINAKTLKLDKVLKQESFFEGKTRSQDLHHITAFKDFEGKDRVVLTYGFGATGGPHFLLDPKADNKVVRAITYDDVRPMGHPYVSADVTGRFLFISMGSNTIREMEGHAASIAKLDLKDGSVVVIPGTGSHPIGTATTSDGKTLYVADGHGSYIYKINLETNKIVGKGSAGVAGPYGIRLSWDESMLYVMGKGEGTHNVGGGVTEINTATMSVTRDVAMPIETGGQIIDHGILHPDPAKNELWISSSGTWETIVLDLNTKKVTARIPVSFGGDTHGGAFVRYTGDAGQLLIDHATVQTEMFQNMKKAVDVAKAKAAADAAAKATPTPTPKATATPAPKG